MKWSRCDQCKKWMSPADHAFAHCVVSAEGGHLYLCDECFDDFCDANAAEDGDWRDMAFYGLGGDR